MARFFCGICNDEKPNAGAWFKTKPAFLQDACSACESSYREMIRRETDKWWNERRRKNPPGETVFLRNKAGIGIGVNQAGEM